MFWLLTEKGHIVSTDLLISKDKDQPEIKRRSLSVCHLQSLCLGIMCAVDFLFYSLKDGRFIKL